MCVHVCRLTFRLLPRASVILHPRVLCLFYQLFVFATTQTSRVNGIEESPSFRYKFSSCRQKKPANSAGRIPMNLRHVSFSSLYVIPASSRISALTGEFRHANCSSKFHCHMLDVFFSKSFICDHPTSTARVGKSYVSDRETDTCDLVLVISE